MDVSEYAESDFLSVQLVKDSLNKKAVIVNSGELEVVNSKQGQYKAVKFIVEFNGRQKYFRPNKASLRNIIKAWGSESQNYIGKPVLLEISPVQGGNDGIIVKPILQLQTESLG